MAADEKWYFTKEQLQITPSRRCGFDADKELSYRQQAANFIQDMGQKLQVSQLCINTAIVYMHRFYMFHSFTHFPWNTIAAASFFLAAKVEEQPRKLEHVIRVANHCLHRDQAVQFDAKSEQYAAQSQDLVFNENVLLQTLGFDVAIDHPHTHVVRCCHLVRASKDLAQTSYFMASNSLHLTTMCLQYKPTVVACFCIHLACKWSNWQIPKSNEGKDWFFYVDKSVTSELLEQLTAEFLKIFDKCPSRLKRKISSISTINQAHGSHQTIDQLHAASSTCSPFDPDSRKFLESTKDGPTFHPRSHHEPKPGLLATPDDQHKKSQRPHDPASSSQHQQPRGDYREYREKKERDRLEREKAQQQQHGGKIPVPSISSGKHMQPGGSNVQASGSKPSHSSHHRPSSMSGIDPVKMKMHHRPSEVPRDSMSGGHNREHGAKELMNGGHGRDHLNKDMKREHTSSSSSEPQVKVETSDNKQRYDSNRQKVIDPKLQLKQHDPNRHRRELDPKYQKRPDTQQIPNNSVVSDNKKHNVVSSSDKQSNSYLNKPFNNSTSTQQRHKSPFSDVPVTKSSVPVSNAVIKTDTRNGNHSASQPPDKQWPELQQQQQQPIEPDPGLISPTPVVPSQKKTSSLFSPEKTPPQTTKQKAWSTKTPPSIGKRTTDTPQLPTQTPVPQPISPFTSPPPKLLAPPSSLSKRSRTSSSGSEPELRPVVKKLDQISGFENIIRDSKMGIKLPKVPDIIQPICDRTNVVPLETSISKELKPPDLIKPFNTSNSESKTLSQPLVNGIETDPIVISSLLKEAVLPINNLITDEIKSPDTFSTPPVQSLPVTVANPVVPEVDKHKSEHHHKSEKKKKKEKHKHKDKDKSKDEKKKKHKDKDKERHKQKSDKNQSEIEVPLRITISKDKLQNSIIEQTVPVSSSTSTSTSGLKVKISKDRLKTDVISEPPVKIKISKDQIQFNSVVDNGSSRKRERDKNASPAVVPPIKMAKASYNRNQESTRQNGRNSYNKVSQLGDGEASQLRLAESKYHSKGASKAS